MLDYCCRVVLRMSDERYTGGRQCGDRRGCGQEHVQELSPEETRLSETDAKLIAMSLLNDRGAKEEDEVNPTQKQEHQVTE